MSSNKELIEGLEILDEYLRCSVAAEHDQISVRIRDNISQSDLERLQEFSWMRKEVSEYLEDWIFYL